MYRSVYLKFRSLNCHGFTARKVMIMIRMYIRYPTGIDWRLGLVTDRVELSHDCCYSRYHSYAQTIGRISCSSHDTSFLMGFSEFSMVFFSVLLASYEQGSLVLRMSWVFEPRPQALSIVIGIEDCFVAIIVTSCWSSSSSSSSICITILNFSIACVASSKYTVGDKSTEKNREGNNSPCCHERERPKPLDRIPLHTRSKRSTPKILQSQQRRQHHAQY